MLFTAWLNPTNVALSTFSSNPPYSIVDLQNNEQRLPNDVDLESMLLARKPLKFFFFLQIQVKTLPASSMLTSHFGDNQTCERYVGKVKMVMKRGRVADFKSDNDIRKTDINTGAYACNMA